MERTKTPAASQLLFAVILEQGVLFAVVQDFFERG